MGHVYMYEYVWVQVESFPREEKKRTPVHRESKILPLDFLHEHVPIPIP